MQYRLTSPAGLQLPFTPFDHLGDAERIAKSMAVSSNSTIEVWTVADETHASVKVTAMDSEARVAFSIIEMFARAVAKRENGEPVPAHAEPAPRRPKPARIRRTVLRQLTAANENNRQARA